MITSFAPSFQHFQKDIERFLKNAGNWSLLKELWGAVIAKRRTNYNKTKKAQKAVPEKVSEELVAKTRELLLDSLYRLRSYAFELQKTPEVGEYFEMIARVEQQRRA
jgi:hypothetical protein